MRLRWPRNRAPRPREDDAGRRRETTVFSARTDPALNRCARRSERGTATMSDVPELTTSFVAAGAGVHIGTAVPLLLLEAIAPVAVRLLDVSLRTCDGVPLPGVLARS